MIDAISKRDKERKVKKLSRFTAKKCRLNVRKKLPDVSCNLHSTPLKVLNMPCSDICSEIICKPEFNFVAYTLQITGSYYITSITKFRQERGTGRHVPELTLPYPFST